MVCVAVRAVCVPSGHARPCHRHNNVRQPSSCFFLCSCPFLSMALYWLNQSHQINPQPKIVKITISISVVGDRSNGTRHRVFGDSRHLAGVLYQTKTSRKRAGVRSFDAASGNRKFTQLNRWRETIDWLLCKLDLVIRSWHAPSTNQHLNEMWMTISSHVHTDRRSRTWICPWLSSWSACVRVCVCMVRVPASTSELWAVSRLLVIERVDRLRVCEVQYLGRLASWLDDAL